MLFQFFTCSVSVFSVWLYLRLNCCWHLKLCLKKSGYVKLVAFWLRNQWEINPTQESRGLLKGYWMQSGREMVEKEWKRQKRKRHRRREGMERQHSAGGMKWKWKGWEDNYLVSTLTLNNAAIFSLPFCTFCSVFHHYCAFTFSINVFNCSQHVCAIFDAIFK